MSLTEHRRHIRVAIGGVVVQTVDAPSITESIDNLTTVCEFSLAEMPSPEIDVGDTVLVEWIDLNADLVYAMFGGTISAIDVESEPFALVCRCVDQLELLRKIRNGSDLVFGEPDGTPAMTEGEAVEALLTYCGVSYTPADIADSGYVLGEQERVSWLRDGTTSAAQVIAELNRVFRMSLFTIGNNRVIRLPYDPTPSTSTGLYATYTKGVNIDFQAHHRTRGDRDRVQNVWVVRGVTAESAGGSCSSTPWARAEDGGLLVGSSRRARVAIQEFQSDLIQDEELAEQIVRSLMQQTNRLPDEGAATLENDPNVHQCSKIAIVDPTYGIRANPRYYLVRAVNRSGVSMTLDLTAGPGGSDGTVTTGVEKVCTDVHTDLNWPGSFTWPAFDFPPLDAGDPITFTLPDFGVGFELSGGIADVLPIIYCDSEAYANAIAIEAGDWQITGTLTLTSAAQRLTIGVTSADGTYLLTIAGAGYYAGLSAPALRYEMATPDTVRSLVGPSPLNDPITWLLRWTDANKILQCQVETTDFVIDDFASFPAATLAAATTTSSVSGTPTRASETVEHNCSDTPPPPPGAGCFVPVGADWDDQAFSVTFGAGNVQFNDGSQGGTILLIDPAAILDTQAVTWTVHVEFSGPGNGTTDVPNCDFGLYQINPAGPGSSVNIEWNSITGDGFIYLYGFDTGFHQENVTAADIYNGFDLTISWNPLSNTVSYVFDNGGTPITNSVILEAEVGHDLQLRMAFASDSVMQMTTTLNEICVGDPTDLLGINIDQWVQTEAVLSTATGFVVLDGDASGYSDAFTVDSSVDWVLTCTATMLAEAASHDFEIGIAHWTGTIFNSKYAVNPLNSGTEVLYLYTPGDSTSITATPYADGIPIEITLSWVASTTTLSIAITDGVTPHSTSLVDATAATDPLKVYVLTAGPETGGLEITDMHLVVG